MLKALMILSSFTVVFTESISSSETSSDGKSKTVFVLGTLHGGMFENPNYSMLDFQKAIMTFSPTHILTEVRSDHTGPVEGAIDGGIEQSLVYAIADKTGAKIIAVDWFDDDLLQEYFAEAAAAKENQAFVKEVSVVNEEVLKLAATAGMLAWNGTKMRELIRKNDQIAEKHGFLSSLKRNQKICENIKKALEEIESGRVLIVFGASHKYYFDDYLKGNQELEVISDMADWFDPEKAEQVIFDEDINTVAVNYLKESRELLKTRLESGFYNPEFAKALEGKYRRIDQAIVNFLKLSQKKEDKNEQP